MQGKQQDMTDNRLKYEYRPIESLIPYARNARVHLPEQIEQIIASINEVGWTYPLMVDEKGMIIAGHGRLQAAKQMGLTEVPVLVKAGLTDLQKRAYILADNRIPLSSGWDKKTLSLELSDIRSLGADMSLTGFSDIELQAFMPQPEPDDAQTERENAVPDAPAVVVTRPGDIWCLGRHRVICADAADKSAVAALMDGDKAALCFTIPPYSDQREYTTGGIGDWDTLMRGVCGVLPMRANGQVLVNLGLVHRQNEVQPYWDGWLRWMGVCGWRRFGWYVWDQGPGMPGDWNGRLAPSFEFIFHFNKEARYPNKNVPCKFAGEHSHARPDKSSMRSKDGKGRGWTHAGNVTQDFKIPDSIIRVTRQRGGIGKGIDHPAVFPVGLPENMMLTYSSPGDICYEPFSGSGTSLIAAEKTGRARRAVELAPVYVDVALERFRRLYPSIPITLDGTGEAFSDVAARRSAIALDREVATA